MYIVYVEQQQQKGGKYEDRDKLFTITFLLAQEVSHHFSIFVMKTRHTKRMKKNDDISFMIFI